MANMLFSFCTKPKISGGSVNEMFLRFTQIKKAPDISDAFVVAGAGLEPTSASGGYEPDLFIIKYSVSNPISSLSPFQDLFSLQCFGLIGEKFGMYYLPRPEANCPSFFGKFIV